MVLSFAEDGEPTARAPRDHHMSLSIEQLGGGASRSPPGRPPGSGPRTMDGRGQSRSSRPPVIRRPSRPLSASRPRRCCELRRAPCGPRGAGERHPMCPPEHDRVGAASHQSPNLVDHPIERLALGVDRGREAQGSRRSHAGALPASRGRVPRADAHEYTPAAGCPRSPESASGQPAQHLALARGRRANDRHPRAAGDRSDPLDDLDRAVVGGELQPLVGEATGRSSKRAPSASSVAGRPLTESTRTSDANRSERRGARRGPLTRSPVTSSHRLTWAEET